MSERPMTPPRNMSTEKYTRAKNPQPLLALLAMVSANSYQPSTVNKRKMLYTLMAGLPKYSGAMVPKMVDERMAKMMRNTMKAMNTSSDARVASFRPARSLWMLGMNRSIFKLLNNRIERRASTALVAMVCSSMGDANEGRATMSTMKSNLFHPSRQ